MTHRDPYLPPNSFFVSCPSNGVGAPLLWRYLLLFAAMYCFFSLTLLAAILYFNYRLSFEQSFFVGMIINFLSSFFATFLFVKREGRIYFWVEWLKMLSISLLLSVLVSVAMSIPKLGERVLTPQYMEIVMIVALVNFLPALSLGYWSGLVLKVIKLVKRND